MVVLKADLVLILLRLFANAPYLQEIPAEVAMVRFICVLIGLLICTAKPSFAQGRLSGVRDDVSRVPASASPSNNEDDDSVLGSILGALFSSADGDLSVGVILVGGVALSPFYVPALLLDDGYDNRMYFAPHPYAEPYRGYQIVSTELASELYHFDTEAIPRDSWAVRISVENGNDFNGLNRFNGQFKAEHASRWGIVTNWNWFVERLACGCTDETVISDTNLTFRFAQNEIASLYTGLGFRMLTDRHQTDFGFNFTYGGDWFPVRPIVVSGVFDVGTLGNAAVIHTRGTIGAIWQGWEVFTGYDFLRIGSVNLHGPLAGVRWWF
jgi:hypothetical protein